MRTNPGGYRTFDHTADIGLEAWGPTLAEALRAAADGLQALLVRAGPVRERVRRKFNVRAPDVAALTVAWLNELIFAFDVDFLVFRRFEVRAAAPTELTALGYGETVDRSRHQVGTAVKAATYHDLVVAVDPATTRIRVVLDV
ncbi:MAG: archease [Actinobacteria bacterium]|nr:archease [Actinomycetota bacterium]